MSHNTKFFHTKSSARKKKTIGILTLSRLFLGWDHSKPRVHMGFIMPSKHNWDVVGGFSNISCFGYTQRIQAKLNLMNYYIVLILKIKGPKRVADFQPISLCNVTYKVILKMFTSRLKSILAYIISIEQSAFVPGQLIMDNVLIAFKVLYTI